MTDTERITHEVCDRHTPGPWKLDSIFPDIDGYKIWPSQHVRPRLVICAVRNQDSSLAGQAQANAHLIAAAPDMYEALKFIADREDYTFAECSLAEEIVSRAKRALAKAEGEQAQHE